MALPSFLSSSSSFFSLLNTSGNGLTWSMGTHTEGRHATHKQKGRGWVGRDEGSTKRRKIILEGIEKMDGKVQVEEMREDVVILFYIDHQYFFFSHTIALA